MITKAIIQSYDAGTHTVVVRTLGSGTHSKDIPVATTIPASHFQSRGIPTVVLQCG